MSFFANRSSRHAARLGPALTAHPVSVPAARVTPPHWLCCNRHQGEQTVRTGNPFKLAPVLCLALAIPFALAACGGGGGGTPANTGSEEPTERQPEARMEPPESQPPPEAGMEQPPAPNEWPVRTQDEFERVATAGAEKMAEGVSKIAENEPNFGSVIQTSEPRVVGEVEHSGRGFINRVRAKFDLSSKELGITFGSPTSQTVECQFDCYFNINSIRATTTNPTFVSDSSIREQQVDITTGYFRQSDGYRRPTYGWRLPLRAIPEGDPRWRRLTDADAGVQVIETTHGTANTLIRSNIITRWYNNRQWLPEEYRNTWTTRGYYLAYAGRNLLERARDIHNVSLGLFVAGPEYEKPANLPASDIIGRYYGDAFGVSTLRHKNGDISGSKWSGSIELTARFKSARTGGVNTIEGVIGQGGEGPRFNHETFIKKGSSYIHPDRKYQVKLVRTAIKPDGTFRGNVKITEPIPMAVKFERRDLVSSKGKWGGKLSSIRSYKSPNIPKAVAGTIGAEATLEGNTIWTLGGTFEAFFDIGCYNQDEVRACF